MKDDILVIKEKVIAFLKDKKDPIPPEEILEGIGSDMEIEEFKKILDDMKEKVEICMTKSHKYILFENYKGYRKGILDVKRSGDAYVSMKAYGEKQDIFIPKEELHYALDGDLVLVELAPVSEKEERRYREFRDDSTKRFGRVTQILHRDVDNVVGEIKNGPDGLYFEQFERKEITFILDESEFNGCVEGEIVSVEKKLSLGKNKYTARIKRKLGHKDDAEMDIKIKAAKYGIYDEFPEEVMEEARALPTEVLPSDRVGRVDLTDKMIFTIDGKDTKDIDDAIELETLSDGNFKLRVHIADVSHYVKEGSALDKEALKRGTSFYPPGSVIPMLPHILSNGICSLNENVDRCAMTCEMIIDPRGHVSDVQLYPSIIKSNKKMNYDDVNTVLGLSEEQIENGEDIPEGYERYAKTLKDMQYLAHIIRRERENRGATDFDTKEPKIICDINGKPIDITCRDRGEGEKLIEDFMIEANEAVARAFYYNKTVRNEKNQLIQLPGIYRVHETPLPEKIQKFVEYVGSLGHVIKGNFKNVKFNTIKNILEKIHYNNEIEKSIIKQEAVKSMPKAFYSPENLKHFGLASICYTHFTSPIRRYPDLQTHRLIRKFIYERQVDEKTLQETENRLKEVCKHSSDREVAAVEAERECVKMKMAELMEDHVGEEFEAAISGVTRDGAFVRLPNYVEGMVSVRTLEGFYQFDEKKQTLTNKRNKETLTLGTKLIVKCTGASKEASKIDFEIVKNLDLNNDGRNKDKGKTLKKVA